MTELKHKTQNQRIKSVHNILKFSDKIETTPLQKLINILHPSTMIY